MPQWTFGRRFHLRYGSAEKPEDAGDHLPRVTGRGWGSPQRRERAHAGLGPHGSPPPEESWAHLGTAGAGWGGTARKTGARSWLTRGLELMLDADGGSLRVFVQRNQVTCWCQKLSPMPLWETNQDCNNCPGSWQGASGTTGRNRPCADFLHPTGSTASYFHLSNICSTSVCFY